MGWLSNYFDQDFHGDHKEGDEYAANLEFDGNDGTLYGTFTLSIYRVRNGKMGKTPLDVIVKGVPGWNKKINVEVELQDKADDIIHSYTGIHDS